MNQLLGGHAQSVPKSTKWIANPRLDVDGKSQFSVVAGPRNHLDLHNRRVALIERPFVFCGQAQDAREIAVKIYIELALDVRRQRDLVHEGADQVDRFGAVLIIMERFSQRRDLLPVVARHVRVQQHRLFVRAFQHRFQLFAPRGDAREVVFDLLGGNAVLDRLDQPRLFVR